MKPHTVQFGECIRMISKKYRFHDWKTLYEHPDNLSLKQSRSDPACLMPESDVVKIPEKRLKQVPVCGRSDLKCVAPLKKTYLMLNLKTFTGKPEKMFSEAKYQLVMFYAKGNYKADFQGVKRRKGLEEKKYEGTVKKGRIEEEVPHTALDGDLTIDLTHIKPGKTLRIKLNIGFLHPVEEIAGHKTRLHNRGIYCGRIDNTETDVSKDAISKFQRLKKLPPTGSATYEIWPILDDNG